MGEETFNAMPDPPLAGQLNMNELQQLFELAPFGIGVFDRHFRCRSVNQTLADLNGLSREEHYGRYLREIVPTLAPVLEPLFQQIISSGVPRVELNLSGHT
ncbi:PAS domain-containing protein, partial [Aeromonas hydrophila]